MRTASLILLLLLIGGCKSKQVHRTEVNRSDTLIVKKEVIKAPVLSQTLTFLEICDTITGLPRSVEYIHVVDGDSIKLLTTANNTLKLQIKARERTISEKDSEVSRVREELANVKETVRYPIDWTWFFGGIVGGFVIGLTKPWRYLL